MRIHYFFRRLCILKGIFPRDPGNAAKAKNKTYYLSKDIQLLKVDPLVQKTREYHIYKRRLLHVCRCPAILRICSCCVNLFQALGRKEFHLAETIEKSEPALPMDHVLKERYPTFADALRDLDDALGDIFLFAHLRSSHASNAERIATCKRLCREFMRCVILRTYACQVVLGVHCQRLRAIPGYSPVTVHVRPRRLRR